MSSTRQVVPLSVADVSLFAKQLRDAILAAPTPPSHLVFLNLIAKSAGHRNYQALRAHADVLAKSSDASAHSVAPAHAIAVPRDAGLSKPAARALTHFDSHGRLMRFPTQLGIRLITLWGLWCRLPGKRDLTERQVNETIAAFHTFADIATLRRELVNAKMLWRTTDGRVYRKVAVQPDADAQAFLKALLAATARRPS
jgi:hypothetical protein